MNKKLIQGLVLNFALSWTLALTAKLAGLNYAGTNVVIIGVLYMFMPTLSVFILSRFVWKTPLTEWGIKKPKTKAFFAAWAFPYLLVVLTILISLLIPNVKFEPQMEGMFSTYAATLPPEAYASMKNQVESLGILLPIIIFIQSLFGGILINPIAAFGEEYFWRGFLLKQLKNLGWLKSSLAIGIIWGLWHTPLILQGHNYPQHPIIGVPMMIIWCILTSIPAVYFTVKTRSVFTAAIFHGVINASAGLAIIWLGGGSDLLIGITGLAGFIGLIILNSVLFVYDKKSIRTVDYLLKNDY
jgi:membrane protease YdiL (CAAX protease family)